MSEVCKRCKTDKLLCVYCKHNYSIIPTESLFISYAPACNDMLYPHYKYNFVKAISGESWYMLQEEAKKKYYAENGIDYPSCDKDRRK